jgi:hypothetical protein
MWVKVIILTKQIKLGIKAPRFYNETVFLFQIRGCRI